MFFSPLISEFDIFASSDIVRAFFSDLSILTVGLVFSKSVNLWVVDRKILFGFDLSFSAAVKALVEAFDFPSIAKSSFPLLIFSTLTISFMYWPGSGPSFGSSQDLWNR